MSENKPIIGLTVESEAQEEQQTLPEVGLEREQWRVGDFKGMFHFHSSEGSSCGKDDLGRIKTALRMKTGLKYVVMADHIGWPGKAGYWPEKIESTFSHIDDLNTAPGPKLYKGIEANVLPNRTIDASDLQLQASDIVIASIHYRSSEKNEDRTAEDLVERWIAVMKKNPEVAVLGHPLREVPKEYWDQVDWDRLFKVAKGNEVIIELNISDSAPQDLPDDFFKALIRNDNLVVISPDFHNVADYLQEPGKLSPEDDTLLQEYLRLKGPNTFLSEDELKKIAEDSNLTDEEIISKRKDMEQQISRLREIEDSDGLAKIYSALFASEKTIVQVKNRDNLPESRTIDKNPLPFRTLLKYVRRINKLKKSYDLGDGGSHFIQAANIVNLWDDNRFFKWLEDRKKRIKLNRELQI